MAHHPLGFKFFSSEIRGALGGMGGIGHKSAFSIPRILSFIEIRLGKKND